MSQGKPRIVMLANAGHKPLDTRIFHKEAISLQKAGWEVVIIIPNSESFQKENIQILSVPLPVKGWEQLIKCPWRIFRAALRQPRNSIFHLHDSELLGIGLLLKISGRKIIYDAHEDTPLQISYQHWIPALLKLPYMWFYRILEKLAGWWFNAIIVAEPVIAKYFPEKKVVLIRNFPVAQSFVKDKNYKDRENAIVYVGLLSKPRGAAEMIEAHRIASGQVSLTFILGGKFAPASLENELLPAQNVEYKSWLPYEEMVELLGNSKIGIIIPHPIPRYKTNYPVKLFEYMAAGLPVIASKEGESAEFVRESDSGILVNPLSVEETAGAVTQLISNPSQAEEMGKRGKKMIFEKYNWEKESAKLIQLYNSIGSS